MHPPQTHPHRYAPIVVVDVDLDDTASAVHHSTDSDHHLDYRWRMMMTIPQIHPRPRTVEFPRRAWHHDVWTTAASWRRRTDVAVVAAVVATRRRERQSKTHSDRQSSFLREYGESVQAARRTKEEADADTEDNSVVGVDKKRIVEEEATSVVVVGLLRARADRYQDMNRIPTNFDGGTGHERQWRARNAEAAAEFGMTWIS